ncbi:MAG: LTA synthase family protein [Nocardioidaceae bacterium]|nr:LTA synthase family protein [Nocardioidaceae bacterium]
MSLLREEEAEAVVPAPSPARRPPSARRTIGAAMAVSFLWTAGLLVLVDYLQDAASGFVSATAPLLFLLQALVMWVPTVLLVAITGRLWLPLGIVTATWVVVGLINYDKLRFRVEPVYPADISFAGQPGFLLQMADTAMLVRLAVLLWVAVALVVLVGRIACRRFPSVRRATDRRTHRRLLAVRVAAASGCLLLLGSFTHFNSPGDPLRRAFESAGAQWDTRSQLANYVQNGFVAGSLYNLDAPVIDKPAGYSRATMQRIAARYTGEARALNSSRDPAALDGVNIVMVLSESFSDPMSVKGPHLGEDPIPRTRALMRTVPSGHTLAQHYGGGTANMGFETLTGMSLTQFSPQLTYPYSQLLPRYRDWPSAVGYLKSLGHRAVAVHPYKPVVYRRDKAYPVLGFDRFVHDSTMQSQQRLGHSRYISDQAAYQEVEHQIGASDQPLYVDLVTMQNHFPWSDSYDDPIKVTGLDPSATDQASNYLRGINHTDKETADFLTDLRRSPEKTVVLFYGDHLPAVWPDATQRASGVRAMHETPFFLWSNFGHLEPHRLPTTSPVYFFPLILDALQAPLPPYYVLLRDLYAEVPGLANDAYIDADDELVEPADLSPRARALLRDYQLVVYDLSVGHRYSESEMFYPDGAGQASAAGQ